MIRISDHYSLSTSQTANIDCMNISMFVVVYNTFEIFRSFVDEHLTHTHVHEKKHNHHHN